MSGVRFALVVNAGGQSRRMGAPKALLPLPPDGRPLLAGILERMAEVSGTPVVIVFNERELLQAALPGLDARVVADAYPDTGTLGGIATGLAEVDGWAAVVACDLPLINPALFAWMSTLATEEVDGIERWDVIMPMVGGWEEPLHALYHRRCLPAIETRLARGERRVISFLPDVRVRRVEESELRAIDPELHSFVNVNTPEEWQAALALLRGEGSTP